MASVWEETRYIESVGSGVDHRKLLFRYRLVLALFITGLVLSGMTALPLESELAFLDRLTGFEEFTGPPASHIDLVTWVKFVHTALHETYIRFPLFGYATDWLGFGHFVIAAFFVLPFLHPARYRGVLIVGLAACAGVFSVALICGPLRGIPFFWRLIDCSFGVVGAIPLLYCLHIGKKLNPNADGSTVISAT
jgi:hypothetical protein